ncbi:DUF6415 family natural product biosynthesis protein [Streptomyces sp. H27-D2]|uniref:DUF6415 family natural product biosynthesis protein n=1 Tax=Streptomyces sp. H27-D2 TaxID=3046304 RepID=UPI002DB879D7|nr:DUF6415 family natural product biosynthesis protein [Streptomyces sp. H27-D2]MEC4014781.1 DUF6415 family natural product biosynthesis protein [Streptomyces sp. H27-D2]
MDRDTTTATDAAPAAAPDRFPDGPRPGTERRGLPVPVSAEGTAGFRAVASPGAETNGDPVDRDTVKKTISHGLTERSAPLRIEELAGLEQLLRGHIHLLLPEVEAKVDRMRHGGREWYAHRARLDGIRRQVDQGLGAGLLSAQRQVRQLARDCRWLLEQHPDA